MKKYLALFLICATSLGCNNQAKQDYELLLSRIQMINENSSMQEIENVLTSVDHFKQAYPKHKKQFELSQREAELTELIPVVVYHALLDKASKIDENSNIEEVDGLINAISEFLKTNTSDKFDNLNEEKSRIETFRDIAIYNHIRELTIAFEKRDDYSSYEEKIADCDNLIDLYNSNLNLKLDSIRNSKFYHNLNFCKRMKSIVENEYENYNSLKYNPTVASINGFIERYPRSIMREELVIKLDELLLTEFLTSAPQSFASISDINSAVSKARACVRKLSKSEHKLQIQEYITNIESQRRNVLEIELSDQLQYLISAMESAARNKAARAQTSYVVTTCSPRGSQPEVFGYSSTFERIYQVNMKGAYLGWDKRELLIVVTGKLSGNINSGASYSVTGTRITSDKKF